MRLLDPIPPEYDVRPLHITAAMYQEKGEREKQEDALSSFDTVFFALADGVGGLPHGEEAAALAVESAAWTMQLTQVKKSALLEKPVFGRRLFRAANRRIIRESQYNHQGQQMATTLLVLLFREKSYYLMHMGDTQAMIYRNGQIVYKTRPDRDERGSITRVLGVEKALVDPSFRSGVVWSGDVFLLATDGVADWVADFEIARLLSTVKDSEESCHQAGEALCALAQEHGSQDNRSVWVVHCKTLV